MGRIIYMERGWDPEVTRYLRKIISSISYALLWMMSFVGLGMYMELAYTSGWKGILFYSFAAITFFLLLRYLYLTWKGEFKK